MKCFNCGKDFDCAKQIKTTYERYYGVSHFFPNSTPVTIEVCPYCGSEDLDG